jgi:prepilin-type N-terminal cleavage/methylation domain-containing protein
MSAMQFGRTNINIQNKIHTMKMTKTKLAKGFTLVELLVVIAIIAALAALSTPVVLKQQKKANATEAINNAKQIYLLMFEHDQDEGAFPATGTSSNLNFRKFITDGYTTSEDIFYAKTSFTVKPDGNTTTTAGVAGGESGFLYVEGLRSTSPSNAPIVATPQLGAGATATFDKNAFGGTAVVLRNDGGVKSFRINADDQITQKETGSDVDVFASSRIGTTGTIGGTIVGPTAVPSS